MPPQDDSNGDPINLDLILRVQAARMAHDRDALPSKMTGSTYWIESKPLKPTQTVTRRAGRFVISTSLDVVDALWLKVRDANERGELGYKAKVSTNSPTGSAPTDRVIHVATVDADDSADVERVRAALIALGVSPEAMRYEPYQDH